MTIPCKINPLGWVKDTGGLPDGYTRLEYLEGTGTQYILVGEYFAGDTSIELEFQVTKWDVFAGIFGCEHEYSNKNRFSLLLGREEYKSIRVDYSHIEHAITNNIDLLKSYVVKMDCNKFYLNDKLLATLTKDEFESPVSGKLFARGSNSWGYKDCSCSRILWCNLTRAGQQQRQFVPALDPTGAPCMFDLVSRQPFYNLGTGDFTYA